MSTKTATRVLFFGTHPYSTNGYSYVTIELAREMAKRDDIKFSIFGFQNFGNSSEEHKKNREWPSNVYVYDAFANETTKQMGFGFDQVAEFVSLNKPDVVILYNDMVVVSNILDKLKTIENKTFKTIVYIDQVYLYQKKEHIRKLNEEADLVMAFTPYWEDLVKKMGLEKPTDYLCHGFNKLLHYPVPKKLARQYFGLNETDFIITNLNRNQPRKRWDTCLQAFAEVVSRHLEEPIKLLIATAVQGAWNLMEIYERELGKRGISMEQGMKHVILIDRPQQLSDDEVNILYNVADIGINTADGEGWGLTSSQQSGIGIPQVVSNVGGHKEFLDKNCAILVDPKFSIYIDASRDGVGGEAQICDYMDFAEAIEMYYADENLKKKHGEAARKKMLDNYTWDKIGGELYRIIRRVVPSVAGSIGSEPEKISLKDLEKLDETLNINDLKKAVDGIDGVSETKSVVEAAPTPSVAPTNEPKRDKKHKKKGRDKEVSKDPREKMKERLRAKLEEKKSHGVPKEASKEELLEMKRKIEMMLNERV